MPLLALLRRWMLPVGGPAVMIALAVWSALPDGRLHVFVLPVVGEALLVQTPSGKFILVDGGSEPALLALHLGRRLPFWKRSLDGLVLTHADGKRLPGQVAALARYRAAVALAPSLLLNQTAHNCQVVRPEEENRPSALGCAWRVLLDAEQTPLLVAQAGRKLEVDGVVLTVLRQTGTGDTGTLFRLDYGATMLLLAGSLGEAGEPTLTIPTQRQTALIYPWQRTMETPLLTTWRPQTIIFTDGRSFDPPELRTYAERAIGGAVLYHPSIDGVIEVISDGRTLRVVTGR